MNKRVVALALALVDRALVGINHAREEATLLQERSVQLLHQLNTKHQTYHRKLHACLEDSSGQAPMPPSPQNLPKILLSLRSTLSNRMEVDTTIGPSLMELEQPFSELDEIHVAAVRWTGRARKATAMLERDRQIVGGLLRQARARAESLEGRQRLRQMMLIKRRDSAPMTKATKLADAIVQFVQTQQRVAAIKNELSDLELLIEQLSGESKLDHLASLNDNELRQVFGSLHDEIAKLEQE